MQFKGFALIVGMLAVAAAFHPQASKAAPMTVKSAQAELLRLAAPKLEFYDGDVRTGNFMSQQITFPTPCSMTMTRRWGAHRYGGQNYNPGTSVIDTYHFEQGYSISRKLPDRVVIAGIARNARKAQWFPTKSPEAAERAKVVLEWLSDNCKDEGTRINHSPLGTAMSCGLKGMPGFTIMDSGPTAFGYTMFPKAGPAGPLLHVGFFDNADKRAVNFGAYTVAPQFMIPTTDIPKNTARYIFYVDGSELMYGTTTKTSGRFTLVLPARWDFQLPVYRALSKGKQVIVRAFDRKPSQLAQWSFDVSGMRTLEATVRNTVRRC